MLCQLIEQLTAHAQLQLHNYLSELSCVHNKLSVHDEKIIYKIIGCAGQKVLVLFYKLMNNESGSYIVKLNQILKKLMR